MLNIGSPKGQGDCRSFKGLVLRKISDREQNLLTDKKVKANTGDI